MKAVMISIRPKWCELIASGKKTIEVRKNRPKLKPPFTCYVYETNPVGLVVGEFVCDNIDYFDEGARAVDPADSVINSMRWANFIGKMKKEARLTHFDIEEYFPDGVSAYLWHISDLTIYDKPLELTGFGLPPLKNAFLPVPRDLKRPPQSWCYVMRK